MDSEVQSNSFTSTVEDAVKELSSSSAESDNLWLSDLSSCQDRYVNQFVAFLKPELTAVNRGVRLDLILDMLQRAFEQYEVTIGAVRVVSGKFFDRTDIMAHHYGVINAISRRGAEALSEAATNELRGQFSRQLSEHYELLGGHQFLAEYPEVSPRALSGLFDKAGSRRLAAGSYAADLDFEGRSIVLLNGFHPYQLEHFTDPDAVTVLMEGRSPTAWKSLRQQLIGTTDPATAARGSFRRTLLEQSQELSLSEVSQNANGIHMSAGPLEGMAEVVRFFTEPGTGGLGVTQTCFGSALAERSVSLETTISLMSNPILLNSGKSRVPAFDLTEDLNTDEAASILATSETLSQ